AGVRVAKEGAALRVLEAPGAVRLARRAAADAARELAEPVAAIAVIEAGIAVEGAAARARPLVAGEGAALVELEAPEAVRLALSAAAEPRLALHAAALRRARARRAVRLAGRERAHALAEARAAVRRAEA